MGYDKNKIHDLTAQYLSSPSEELLQQIQFEVLPMIRAQLCTKYGSVSEYFEDMEAECSIKIWQTLTEHPERVEKFEKFDQFYWYLIREVLFKYTVRHLKHHLKGRGFDALNPNTLSHVDVEELEAEEDTSPVDGDLEGYEDLEGQGFEKDEEGQNEEDQESQNAEDQESLDDVGIELDEDEI